MEIQSDLETTKGQPAIPAGVETKRVRAILLGSVILLIPLIVFGLVVVRQRGQQALSPSTSTTARTPATGQAALSKKNPSLPVCSDQPLFTVLPMKEADFFAFRPLGWVTPPTIVFPLKHSTFSITQPGEPENRRRPVVFPGDVTVTRINTTEWIGKNKTGYQLYFDPCQGVQAYFYHLGNLADNLMTAIKNYAGEPNCRQYYAGYNTDVNLCQYLVHIPVKAGDGAGESGDGASVDFGMIDRNAPELLFAVADHYSEELKHYVSPVNYFTPGLRARLLAKTGSYDGQVIRTREPREGAVAQDIIGTAQGNWFEPGKDWNQFPPPDNATFIALVHDYVGPEPIFSVGTTLAGVKSGLYSFTPETSSFINRDFSEVKPGAVYCYDRFTSGQTTGKVGLGQLEGILILELTDAKTLKIEKLGSAGITCSGTSWTFTEKASTYSR